MYIYIPQNVIALGVLVVAICTLSFAWMLLTSIVQTFKVWSWMDGSAHLKFHNSYTLICYKQESKIPCEEKVDTILLAGALAAFAPRVTGLHLTTPGACEDEVPYHLQSTRKGVLIALDRPISKPSNATERGGSSVILSLKSPWTGKRTIMRFVWEDPPPPHVPSYYQYVLDQERATPSDEFDLETALKSDNTKMVN